MWKWENSILTRRETYDCRFLNLEKIAIFEEIDVWVSRKVPSRIVVVWIISHWLQKWLLSDFIGSCKRPYRSSFPEVFCKGGVLRNFAKFTGKRLCESLFFSKVAGQRLFLQNTSGGCSWPYSKEYLLNILGINRQLTKSIYAEESSSYVACFMLKSIMVLKALFENTINRRANLELFYKTTVWKIHKIFLENCYLKLTFY